MLLYVLDWVRLKCQKDALNILHVFAPTLSHWELTNFTHKYATDAVTSVPSGRSFKILVLASLNGHTSQITMLCPAENLVAPVALAHMSLVRRRIESVARALVNLSAVLPDPVARETRIERAGMVSAAGALSTSTLRSGELPVVTNSQGLSVVRVGFLTARGDQYSVNKGVARGVCKCECICVCVCSGGRGWLLLFCSRSNDVSGLLRKRNQGCSWNWLQW